VPFTADELYLEITELRGRIDRVMGLIPPRTGGGSILEERHLHDLGNHPGGVIAARVYNSANISTANGANTALTFNSERFDTDSIHSTSSNTGRLTATIAGKYLITALVRWAANVTGRRTVFLRLNGSTDIAHTAADAATGGINTVQEVSCLYDMAVGDYVEAVVNQNSGGALNVDAASNYSPEFMMARVGASGGAPPATSGADHGGLDGLGDDDHSLYLLAAGTRAGSTGAPQDFGFTGIKTDVIAESTGAAGVTADGVKMKDGSVIIADAAYIGSVSDPDAIQIEADGDVLLTQDLLAMGVVGAVGIMQTLDDLRIGDGHYIGSISDPDAIEIEANGDVKLTQDLFVDTINETTGAAGVLIDGTRLKDGGVIVADGNYIGSISDPDAIQIEADGDVVLTQDLAVTGALTAASYGGITEANLVDKSATEAITGSWDFGGATQFEIPNDNAPTAPNVDGEMVVDLSVADWSHGLLEYYGGELMGVVAMPIAQFTSPTDNYVVTYNAATDEFELQAGGGGNGGSGSLITLTEAPADHAYTGIDVTFTFGETISFGQVCYFKSDGKMWKADADAIATASAIGLCMETTKDADETGKFLLYGIVRDDSFNWTVGELIYLSTTLGTMQHGAPSGTDDVVQILGVALHADRMLFNPQLVQVEHV
jgi:hypothetical protein